MLWIENYTKMKKGLITNFYFKFSILFVLLGVAVSIKPEIEDPKDRTIKNLNILQNGHENDLEEYNPEVISNRIKKS